MLWQHGEKELKKFLEILNSYHPTIISTATYSRQKVTFLQVEVIKKKQQLSTDLYIKPTDTHKYLHASSSHAFHSEKSNPQSQALSLNRIFSENQFFDKRSNDLEIWLKGRRYSDKLFRKQILKARKFSRAELLNNQRKKDNEDKLFFNITYHTSLAQLKHIMTRIHLLLKTNHERNKFFRKVPITGFRRAKSLKDILVRAKIHQIKKMVGGALLQGLLKFANILNLLQILHHLLQNAHMRLDQKI